MLHKPIGVEDVWISKIRITDVCGPISITRGDITFSEQNVLHNT